MAADLVHSSGNDSRGRAGSQATSRAPGRFLALDGLRGVAAIAVIFDHVPQDMVNGFLPGRALSVDFFFVLSGFVLAHAYGARLGGTMSPLAFMKLRLIRLYPLYLLGTLVALPVAIVSAWKGWASAETLMFAAPLGLLFLPTPQLPAGLNSALYPLNGPAWTLFYELIANFVYAVFARFLTLRVLACLLPVAAAALVYTLFRHADVTGPGWLWAHADAGFARVTFDFFAGVFLYRLRHVWRAPALPVWLSIAAFLAIIGAPVSGAGYDALAAIVMLPLLIMFAADAKITGVAARVCGALGRLSYAIYMLHVPLIAALTLTVAFFGLSLPGFVFVGLLIAVASLAAALADRYYDEPVRKRLAALLIPRKPVAKVPETAGGA